MLYVLHLLLAVSSIQIDGNFADWPSEKTDLVTDHFTYKIVELQQQGCLQQLPDQLKIEIGGYDIIFSPTSKGYGVACFNDGKWISPYDIGLVFAPTTASTKFEVRVDVPDTKVQKVEFDLGKTDDAIRVISWNIQFGNLLDQKERSIRMLSALQPDVLLFQEFDGDDTPERITDILEVALGGSWQVSMSAASGDVRHEQLRSAIATRFPLQELPQIMSPVSYPLKIAMARIRIDETDVMFVSLHLRCCGGPTSEAELQRQVEANAIRTALQKYASDAVIIGGDWNLVGTTKPLDTVRKDGFAVVEAYQPDGTLTATWADAKSSFTPGRLDWMLVRGKALNLSGSFVLDTFDLHPDTLVEQNLRTQDTKLLSDHLPLVADLRVVAQ